MRWVVLTLLLGLCAGCEPDPPAPRPAVVDPERPCAFASADEVGAAVGSDRVASPLEGVSRDASTRLCSYGVGRPFNTVTLYVEDDVTEDEFRERMNRDPLNTDPLEGAGEIAFTHAGVSVSVWDGGRSASAGLQHFGSPDATRTALEELAGLIDSKL